MDFLRQQWAQIQERLAGLNASQKMLVAALVVITVMTMLYWGKYASGREMIALSSVPMSAEELQTAQQSLQSKGIKFTVNGNALMVPADDQMTALSVLSFSQALPKSPNFFEPMFEKVSAFSTATDYKARLNNARERTLSAMMAEWPDVKSASVLINDPQQNGIGRFEPRATVNIATHAGTGSKKFSLPATNLVHGAVSGLKRENITVLIDGRSVNMPSDSLAGAAGDAFEQIRNWEIATSDKLRHELFSFIPSVLVTVTAEIDTRTKTETIEKVDPTNKVVIPSKSTSDTTTTNEPAVANEPGLISNAGMDATASAAVPMAGSTSEKTTEENVVAFGKTQMQISTPAGTAKIIGAALRVPRSYFVKIWRLNNSKAEGEPDATQYAAVYDKVTSEMRAELQGITGIADATKITVNEFPDFDGLASLMNPGKSEGSSLGSASFIATNYAKEAAVGVLALASLFMVSRIVKKSVPAPAVALAGMGGVTLSGGEAVGGGGKTKGSVTLAGDELIAGEVAEGGAVLMGQELDPATLETAQMIEQVSNYVKENPETAANLIRRLVSAE